MEEGQKQTISAGETRGNQQSFAAVRKARQRVKNNEESCRAEEIARVEVKMLKEEGLKQAADAGTRPV